jgi:uncharacterized protein YsxB (DUF464 family)
MIKWSIIGENNCVHIDIKGHAGYAKYGQDIVCASVSTLVYFFISCIEHIDDSSIKHLQINDGDVKLMLNISEKIKPLLEVFQLQLKAVETQYPRCLMEVTKND